MFNTVEKHQKLVKGLMIVLGAAFALWGIGGYLGTSGDDGYVAKVGSSKIYPRDIDQAMEGNTQQQNKMQVLFGLINRQVLLNHMKDTNQTVTNFALRQEIAKIPLFQENGQFSLEKYTTFLHEKLMSAEQFQQRVTEQILLNQTVDFFKNSYFSSTDFDNQFAKLLSRDRNISTFIIKPTQFYPSIKINDAQIKSYYQANLAKFTMPEQVKLQYIVLDQDSVKNNIIVSPAEIDAYLKDHPGQTGNEQIDVSHILFTVPANSTAKERSDIKARAEKILEEVKANPSSFAMLASKFSQDPGSAKNGGDLGFFSHGVMVKAFDAAAFKLKPGQISDLVTTEYGYHILKMNAIKNNSAADASSFALDQIRKQRVTKEMAKDLDQLNNLTYNDPKSLDNTAKKLNLTVKTSDWVAKNAPTGNFADPKIQKAIFASDVIKDHNNSEVVDLSDGSHAVYRVIADKPSQIQALESVSDQITTELKAKDAAVMVMNLGQKQLQAVQNGTTSLDFSNTQDINLLSQNPTIDLNSVKQIFSVKLAKLPAYSGSINNNGEYVIYRINSEKIDPKLEVQNKAAIAQLDSNNAMLDLDTYVQELRSQYNVSYHLERLKQDQE